MTDTKALLGRNIRGAREKLGLRQTELAAKVGHNSSETISQIELGKRDVKAWELSRIAKALKVEMAELLSDTGPVYGPAPLWRDEPTNNRNNTEALLRLRSRRYRQILDLVCDTKAPGVVFHDDLNLAEATYAQARALADTTRQELALGDTPGQRLLDTLEEECGVMVFYDNLGANGSAVSVRGPFGCAMLLNVREAPWRRAFSCAHELFHLITWGAVKRERLEEETLRRHVEKLANAFASSLLLPEQPLRARIDAHLDKGRLALEDIIAIARHFRVSTSALLWRMVDLEMLPRSTAYDVLDDPSFRAQDRRTMPDAWWTPAALPKRFVERAVVAYSMGKLSRARLAEMMEQDLSALPEFLASYDLDIDHLEAEFEISVA